MCDCGKCNETEKDNNFWADVYYHMEIHAVDEKTAIKEIEKLYKELESK